MADNFQFWTSNQNGQEKEAHSFYGAAESPPPWGRNFFLTVFFTLFWASFFSVVARLLRNAATVSSVRNSATVSLVGVKTLIIVVRCIRDETFFILVIGHDL